MKSKNESLSTFKSLNVSKLEFNAEILFSQLVRVEIISRIWKISLRIPVECIFVFHFCCGKFEETNYKYLFIYMLE